MVEILVIKSFTFQVLTKLIQYYIIEKTWQKESLQHLLHAWMVESKFLLGLGLKKTTL